MTDLCQIVKGAALIFIACAAVINSGELKKT